MTKTWDDIPIAEDGWVLAHDALRHDMETMTELLAVLLQRVQNGALEPWMTAQTLAWWNHTTVIVKNHHDHEEQLFFPMMFERINDLPPKISDDHTQLLANLAAVTEALEALAGAGAEATAELVERAQELHRVHDEHMREHLLEEEQDALPRLREHFSVDEVNVVVKQMVGKMEWWEMPAFLRRKATPDEKVATMQTIGVPWFVARFILLPKCNRYEREYVRSMQEVLTPELRGAGAEGGGCVVM